MSSAIGSIQDRRPPARQKMLLVVFIFSWPGGVAWAAEPTHTPETKSAPPYVVLVAYEDEYEAARTLRDFARLLQERYGCRTRLLVGQPENDLPGLEVLAEADVLVLYVRRKALPVEQMKHIRAYVEAGRPLVALRTSSHAFALRTGSPPTPKQQWPEFDNQVLGGNYHGHTGKQYPATEIFVAPEAAKHPILAGIEPTKWQSRGSLYLVSPIDPKATVLLWGQAGPHKEPVAWTRTYRGGRVFYTSLGHPDDFDHCPQFVRLLVQAVFWAMNRPVPTLKRP
ncbi:MAG: ThuA domain-containing protein [Thermoguttaceae bacterium]|nr:ThuA domain-containing protein [Thermoguttaceae bacterium]MDW8037836.1 ThuA domain-containing protein [Thermoguttaceae bacterium]